MANDLMFDPLGMPLFMQSGMMEAPPQQAPFTRALPNYEQMSPFELAAMRTRETVRPTAGRADMDPNTIATMVMMGAPIGRVAGLAGQAIRSAPKLAGSLMAGGASLLGMNDAGEAGDQVDPRLGKINQIEMRMEKARSEINRLGTTRTPSPKGTQELAIRTLQQGIEQDAAELERLRAEFSAEQEAAKVAAEQRRQAEMGIRERYPWLGPAATVGAPALGALGGAIAGRGGRGAGYGRLGTMLGAGAGGAFEGGLVRYLQTEADNVGLPRTSPAQQEAAADLQSPNWWMTQVLPAAAASGGAAMLGAKYGFGWPRKTPMPAAGLAGPAGSQPMLPNPATAAAAPSLPAIQASRPPIFDKKNGMWRDPSTGRFARPPENPPPLMGP
jgi:hypothetical protein